MVVVLLQAAARSEVAKGGWRRRHECRGWYLQRKHSSPHRATRPTGATDVPNNLVDERELRVVLETIGRSKLCG